MKAELAEQIGAIDLEIIALEELREEALNTEDPDGIASDTIVNDNSDEFTIDQYARLQAARGNADVIVVDSGGPFERDMGIQVPDVQAAETDQAPAKVVEY